VIRTCGPLPSSTSSEIALTMTKDEFARALRDRLRKMPLDNRRGWDETRLLEWWTREKSGDTYLRWERDSGNPWKTVLAICRDMIGPDAVQ
jgi:hypothetical protein